MYRRRRVPPGNGGFNMAHAAALQAVLQFAALPHKPPVTAAIIVANVAVFYKPGLLNELLLPAHAVCLNSRAFLQTLDLKRLLLSAFYHSDDVHLIYNMVSLLWKGYHLESRLGSARYAKTVALLLVLSHGSFVAVSSLLANFTNWVTPYRHECAIGFSAVIFAMKTILNASEPTYTRMHGFLIPTRYAAWAELVLIQLLVPNASFLGHLCGILAGLLYLNAGRAWSIGMALPYRLLQRFLPRPWLWRWRGQRHVVGRRGGQQRASSRDAQTAGDERGARPGRFEEATGLGPRLWRCAACTYDNPLHRDRCEMCETPRGSEGGSSWEPSPTNAGWSLDDYVPAPPSTAPWTQESERALNAEELRRRRLERFSR